jgi:alpha-tubulin suppressor-like RCC1 family protein
MSSRRSRSNAPEEAAPEPPATGGAQGFYAKMKAASEAAAAAAAAADGGSASAAPAAAPVVTALSIPTVKPPQRGALVIFGATNYAEMGKKVGLALDSDELPNLQSPHRLVGLGRVRLAFVATGCNSAHVIAVGSNGEVYAWGRNDGGQLGLGDLTLRHAPERVVALDGKGVHAAATGKAHTLFLTGDGGVLACGAGKQARLPLEPLVRTLRTPPHPSAPPYPAASPRTSFPQGACGPAAKNKEQATTPVAVPFGAEPHAKVAAIAAGANFNLAIDKAGEVWSWGWSEFGVIGNGTDHEYNMAEGTVKLSYQACAAPERVKRLAGLGCVHVACGQQHCAAIGGDGTVFTWGAGGYGRLGHKDQADVHEPKPLVDCRGAQVGCGAVHTAIMGFPAVRTGVFAMGAKPQLFCCGRVKSAMQNSWMYPKTEDELRGWNLHHLGVGAVHTAVHADDCTIAWGSGAASGQLGLGESGKKSSANPAKVPGLDGVAVAQIACGVAGTYLLVELGPQVEALPLYRPPGVAEDQEPDEPDDDKPAAKKSKTGAGKAAKKTK